MVLNMRSVRPFLAQYGLLISGLFFGLLMYRDSLIHPVVSYPASYGQNQPGELRWNLTWGVVELGGLYVILNPEWKRWMTLRMTVAILLYWSWTALFSLLTIHAGNISMIHLIWLLLVDIGLFIAWISRLLSRASY